MHLPFARAARRRAPSTSQCAAPRLAEEDASWCRAPASSPRGGSLTADSFHDCGIPAFSRSGRAEGLDLSPLIEDPLCRMSVETGA